MTTTPRKPLLCLFAALAMAPGMAHAQSSPPVDLGPDAPRVGDAGVLPPSAVPGPSSLITVQSGNENQAVSTISGAGATGGNTLTQLQIGNANTDQAAQIGPLNSLNQIQIGNGNSQSASQLGNGNALVERQFGNNTTGVTVTQTGGAHATVTQIR